MSFLNNEQNTHLESYDIRYIYYIGYARCPRNEGLQTKQTDYEIHNLQKISFYCLFPQIHKKLLDVISWSRYAKNLTVLSGLLSLITRKINFSVYEVLFEEQKCSTHNDCFGNYWLNYHYEFLIYIFDCSFPQYFKHREKHRIKLSDNY